MLFIQKTNVIGVTIKINWPQTVDDGSGVTGSWLQAYT